MGVLLHNVAIYAIPLNKLAMSRKRQRQGSEQIMVSERRAKATVGTIVSSLISSNQMGVVQR